MSEPDETERPALWAERTGTRTFTGRNLRGAEVLIGNGDAPGVFTPGELLQIALAGCVGQSTDHRLAHALGDDFHGTVVVSVEKNADENRYETFDVEVIADLGSVDEAARDKAVERGTSAIERGCTVGRTLVAGATYRTVFTSEAAR